MRSDPKKAIIQAQAKQAWKDGGEWGVLAMATGTGKSKVAIDAVTELYDSDFLEKRVLLVVPTEKLRDTNWLDEFNLWGAGKHYAKLQRSCYASITKFGMQYYDLVILDEVHNLTEANSDFFMKNTVKRVIGLTATPPNVKGNETEKAKVLLFKQFRLKTDFEYSLEEAVRDKLVAPYQIKVIECNLDNTTKYIKGGTKAAPFLQTEQARYDYLSKIILKMQMSSNPALKFQLIARMRVIYDSIAKTEVARQIINKHSLGERTIVFCGSIKQAEELAPGLTFHSKTNSQALDEFKAEEIDLLAVVEALNEGHNVPNVDMGIIVQLSSSARDLVQRIGRLIRKRPGHKALIWIIVAIGTQDEKWFKKAIAEFDQKVISYFHAKNI